MLYVLFPHHFLFPVDRYIHLTGISTIVYDLGVSFEVILIDRIGGCMSMGFRRLFSSISVGVLISGLIIPHEQGSAMDSVDDFSSNIDRSSSEGQGSGNSSCKKVDWEGFFEEKEISPEQLPGYDGNFHNIVLDRSLKAIRELGVYSYLNERNIEVSDRIEYHDIKFYKTFLKIKRVFQRNSRRS